VLESLACPCCESSNVVVLWFKCDDCGEVTARQDARPYARPKRDRRREPRKPACAVAPFNHPGSVLMDVTLRRGDEVRRWTISSELDGWSCRLVTPTSVTVSRCGLGDAVVAKEREWRAEIEAARAEGWS
jgi:hypothetical protein